MKKNRHGEVIKNEELSSKRRIITRIHTERTDK